MKMTSMIKTAFIIVLMNGSLLSLGQNISITFTGTGAATQVDSVTATNLTTNERVTLPGNETLILAAYSVIPSGFEQSDIGMVYPNPFSGTTVLSVSISKPQTVYMTIQNLLGQVVAQTQDFLQPGGHEFAVTVNAAGIYWVSLTSEQGTSSYKVICTKATDALNRFHYRGNGYHRPQSSELKSSQTGYTLGYNPGEIILYQCYGGIYKTIITDTPADSKRYEVNFIACADMDGNNYSIVTIGNQTWMGENMRYLPSVSLSTTGSVTEPYHYVYGYDGTSIDDARQHANFKTYGVLYNWPAAAYGSSVSESIPSGIQGICPAGWHLPSDGEWKVLEMYLGMTQADADLVDYRQSGLVGGQLKESGTNYWQGPKQANNSSGFTALPGGYRHYNGSLIGLGSIATFWSTTVSDGDNLFYRSLNPSELVNRSGSYMSNGLSVRCVKNETDVVIPTIMTAAVYSIKDETAASGGNIINDGGSEIIAKGVCWSTSSNPTINGNKTTDGTGRSHYASSLTGLEANTIYYVKAYAANNAGTGYGDEISFTTCEGSFEYDGRSYGYRTIGTQTWMTENLAYLPAVSSATSGSATAPFYYVNGYKGTDVVAAKATDNYNTYGVLYNWTAAQTACPSGWHLPGDEEWKVLEMHLGMSKTEADSTMYRKSGEVGNKLREAGTRHWHFPNTGATNSSGFSALPGGGRSQNGVVDSPGYTAGFWSNSESSSSNAWYRYLFYNSVSVIRDEYYKKIGFSVRCIKD